MAVDMRGADGHPRFLGTSAPATADDLTTLGEEAYRRGTRLIGSQAEMDAYPYPVEGLMWRNTTDNGDYVRVGSVWKSQGMRLLATSGGTFLDAGQSISLSEPITQQRNGIVIAWSRYTSASEDIYWNYQHVPKIALTDSNDGSIIAQLTASTNGSLVGHKVIYFLSDSEFRGHSANRDSPNNRFVLRAVYGY